MHVPRQKQTSLRADDSWASGGPRRLLYGVGQELANFFERFQKRITFGTHPHNRVTDVLISTPQSSGLYNGWHLFCYGLRSRYLENDASLEKGWPVHAVTGAGKGQALPQEGAKKVPSRGLRRPWRGTLFVQGSIITNGHKDFHPH